MTAIVFDLDGTLIDSAPDLHLAIARMLEAEGKPVWDLATTTSFTGDGLPKLVERSMRKAGLPMERHEELSGAVLVHYNEVNGSQTTLYPGVVESLQKLKEHGHRLGLCTNKPHSATVHTLELFGLSDFFEIVIGGDSLATRKPDPEGLNLCYQKLGGQGVFVGDTIIDADTAVRCKVPFALFTLGYRKAEVSDIPHDAAFDDYGQLSEIVANLSK